MDIHKIKDRIVADVKAELATKLQDLQEEIARIKEMMNSAYDVIGHKTRFSIDRDIERIVEKHLREIEIPAPVSAAGTPDEPDAHLFETLQAIDHGRSQIEILTTLVNAVQLLTPRVLLLVAKGETLVGWSGKGLNRTDAEIKRMAITLNVPSSLKHVVDTNEFFWGEAGSHSGNTSLFSVLGGGAPKEILVTPLLIKGKSVAILYCDDGGTEGALKSVERVKILAWATSTTLDALPYRAKVTRPLPPAAAQPQPPAAPPPPPPEAVRAPAAAPHPRPALISEPPTLSGIKPISVPQMKPQDPRSMTHPELALKAQEEQRVADHLAGLSPEDKKRHDDAKRLARVLVADLILYHRTDVELGRRNNDLYKRLQQDIDRSREAYRERIGPELAAKTNYLYDELVKTLADGHPEALAGY